VRWTCALIFMRAARIALVTAFLARAAAPDAAVVAVAAAPHRALAHKRHPHVSAAELAAGWCGDVREPEVAAPPRPPRRGACRSRIDVALNCSERYVTALSCGELGFLFSRAEVVDTDVERPQRHYRQLYRSSRSGLDGPWSAARDVFGDPEPVYAVGENTAYVCEGSEVVAYGGLGSKNATLLGVAGIWRGAAPAAARLAWGPFRRAISADARESGCREALHVSGVPEHQCLFDGKLSVAALSETDYRLYARANRCARGGRGAQVASSADGGETWGAFSPLDLAGLGAPRSNTNVYFVAASAVPAAFFERAGLRDVGPWVFACFPAVLNGTDGGVFCAPSADGVSFATPRRVVASAVRHSWRTSDHAVDLDAVSASGKVELWVHEGVSVPRDARDELCSTQPRVK